MNKTIAGLVVSAAAILSLGGAAQASYPPADPGSLTITDNFCDYLAPDYTEIEFWMFSVNYEASSSDATLTISTPSASYSEVVGMGSGVLLVDEQTPGFASWAAESPFLVTLETPGQVLSEQVQPCWGAPSDPDPTDPIDPGPIDPGPIDPDPWPEPGTAPGTLDMQPPECVFTDGGEVDEPELVSWSFTVDYNITAPNTSLTVSSPAAFDDYTIDVPVGPGSTTFSSDLPGFEVGTGYEGHLVLLVSDDGWIEEWVPSCLEPDDGYPGWDDPIVTEPEGEIDVPGTMWVEETDCNFEEETWSLTVGYEITEPDTILEISDASGSTLSKAVPLGLGLITIDSNSPEFDSLLPDTFFNVSLISADLVNEAWFAACPVPVVAPGATDAGSAVTTTTTVSNGDDVVDAEETKVAANNEAADDAKDDAADDAKDDAADDAKDDNTQQYPPGSPGTLKIIQDECTFLPSDGNFGGIKDWGFTINYSVTSPDTTLSIAPLTGGAPVYKKDVAIGVGSLNITMDSPGFDNSSPNLFYVVTLESNGVTTTANVNGCPIPDVDNTNNNGNNGGTGNNKGPSDNTTANTSVTLPPPTTKLPETGLDTTGLLLISAILVGSGIALILTVRHRPAGRIET